MVLLFLVVIALVKLENLKAIHNSRADKKLYGDVVIALVKLENLKAIHNANVLQRFLKVLLLH